MDTTPLQLPELPEPPKKHEYENAQFEPEAPQLLSGVMNRWVAPEGYTGEEEPAVFTVHKLPVVEEEQEEEEMFLVEGENPPRRLSSSRSSVFRWTFGIAFAIMLLANVYLIFFRK